MTLRRGRRDPLQGGAVSDYFATESPCPSSSTRTHAHTCHLSSLKTLQNLQAFEPPVPSASRALSSLPQLATCSCEIGNHVISFKAHSELLHIPQGLSQKSPTPLGRGSHHLPPELISLLCLLVSVSASPTGQGSWRAESVMMQLCPLQTLTPAPATEHRPRKHACGCEKGKGGHAEAGPGARSPGSHLWPPAGPPPSLVGHSRDPGLRQPAMVCQVTLGPAEEVLL